MPSDYDTKETLHNYNSAGVNIAATADGNPLVGTLLISSIMNLPAKLSKPNDPELLPINPYLALLLSQYGRYLPSHGTGRGLYAYTAANNFHNNQPIGSYKIYEETE